MATVKQYVNGSLVKLVATFTDDTDVHVDPDTVTVKVKLLGSATIDTPAVVKDTTGVYHSLYSTIGKAAGPYYYRWEGVGTVQAAGEGRFTLLPSKVV